MRRFTTIFVFSLFGFGVANVLSGFVRSPDAWEFRRYGFPFTFNVVMESSGPVFDLQIDKGMFWTDIAVAVLISAGIALLSWRYVPKVAA